MKSIAHKITGIFCNYILVAPWRVALLKQITATEVRLHSSIGIAEK